MMFSIVRRSGEVPSSVEADAVTVTEGGALIFRNIQEVELPDGKTVQVGDLVLAVGVGMWITVEPIPEEETQ